MADLRAIAADLGCVAPRTLLNSGNLVFGAAAAEGEGIARALSNELAARLGVTTAVIVRAADAWDEVIAANPWPDIALADPAGLMVIFLDQEPAPSGIAAMAAVAAGGEAVSGAGREVFIHYARGVAESKLTPVLIGRRLGAVGTARNWNTVMGLRTLAQDLAADFGAPAKAG
jgi:uncharacterized protein (DUF1697 family)